MRRIRIIHRLRTLLATLTVLVIAAAGVGLWWANRTGMPEAWRDEIEGALAHRGIHAEIGSLRLSLVKGIEAGQVEVFLDPERRQKVARLDRMFLDIDRSKLSRGQVQVEQLSLNGGDISMPTNPDEPDGRMLTIRNPRGELLLSGDRHLELHHVRGEVNGILVEYQADHLLPRQRLGGSAEDAARDRQRRREILDRLIAGLETWVPETGTPPVLKLRTSGDLENPERLQARFTVSATQLSKEGIRFDLAEAAGSLNGTRLVLDQVLLKDAAGILEARGSYDIRSREGRVSLRSSIDPKPIIDALAPPSPDAPEWSPGKRPELTAQGRFAFGGDQPGFHVDGRLKLDQPAAAGIAVDRLEGDFSCDGRQLYLQDLRVELDGRHASGRSLISPEQVRYAFTTDLPVSFWQRAIPFEPLKSILADFNAAPETEVEVSCTGRANPADRHDWHFAGEAEGTLLSFRGVPTRHARVTLDLDHDALDFTAGRVTFDYRDYPLRKAHDGPLTGSGTVDRIRYRRDGSVIDVEGVKGSFWPAPLVRTFAPEVADHLESYGFHRTPTLGAGGYIGVLDNEGDCDLTVDFSTGAPADYTFLDRPLTFAAPSGRVRLVDDEIRVTGLEAGLFEGRVRGGITAPAGGQGAVSGEIDWTRLSLPDLCRGYGIKVRPPGYLTGRIEFTQRGAAAAGLDAEGLIGLEQGELFSVPMFGPLSGVISAVLGNRKAGFQEARDAFCTFAIRRGLLRTDDFLTTTSSLVFTGDARVDLSEREIEMTVRMNARGLLSVITLPLRPFYGMFQFRGTGPIDNPKWENVMFTSPPESQKVLLDPPKARSIQPPGQPPGQPPARR